MNRLALLVGIVAPLLSSGCCHEGTRLKFSALDAELRTMIVNTNAGDEVLLQSISHLGKVTERPEFWTQIANNPGYPVSHRSRAVCALFRRHCLKETVSTLASKLAPAQWLRDGDIEDLRSMVWMGPSPLSTLNSWESGFVITVLNHSRIFIRVGGKISRQDFSRLLRKDSPNLLAKGLDDPILEYGFTDDYDEWLHPQGLRGQGRQ